MAEAPKIRKAKKLAKTELVPFTRQLASMSAAGMPILATIMTLEEQCSNPEFKKVLNFMNKTIESGEPLSKALSAFPAIFDDMYVNMVVAGEQSGEFAGILKRLASILGSSSRLRNSPARQPSAPRTGRFYVCGNDGGYRSGDTEPSPVSRCLPRR